MLTFSKNASIPGLAILAISVLLPLRISAATGPDTLAGFQRSEAFVPMRDGVRLSTMIFAPISHGAPLPIVLERGPYAFDDTKFRSRFDARKRMVEDSYIFVYQNIRGRYKSEGKFVMWRPGRDRSNPKSIDESTDTYDTIDWLIRNLPGNNGRVGLNGTSYNGWLAIMGTIEPHPALKAVVEKASPADMYIGDDFHHNGAFRLSYGFEYAFMEEASNVDTLFPFDLFDTYEWYLRLGPLSNAKKTHAHLPTWIDFAAHPDYDQFWKNQALAGRSLRVTVPTLHVAGWWDQEDAYGPLKAYELLERTDTAGENYLVAGPWNHGSWNLATGHRLGNIRFGDSTASYYRDSIEAPWFAHFLKEQGTLDLPEALAFRTGTNRWIRHPGWPPSKGVTLRNLYFRENGSLSFTMPTTPSGADSFVSDPSRPVPYRTRPVESTYARGSRWGTWLTEDQRFVHQRPDVLSWVSETLTEDVVVSGNISAHLLASTSGTDCDWVVKLIDVYPGLYPDAPAMGGYQLMIAADVFRGRYLKSFEKPQPLMPGRVEEFAINLLGHDHCFRSGHRIMVQVQSTWFPIVDRNPQKYVANIFEATEADFQPATQHVYRCATYPSHIQLPVMERP
jgi:hypothetical protein